MFAKSIIDSDTFLDMPLSAQALYFHLSMRADDDGFVNNPKKIMRMISADEDSMKLLIAKQFLIPFDSGIVVIRHWRIHNYIRKDRYQATVYTEEQSKLTLDEGSVYRTLTERSTNGQPSDIPAVDTGKDRLGKDRLGKDRLGKDRLGKERRARAREQTSKTGSQPDITFSYVALTPEQYSILTTKYPKHVVDEYIQRVDDYCKSRGRGYPNYPAKIAQWIDEDVAKGRTSLAERNYDVDEWQRFAESIDPTMLMEDDEGGRKHQ